MLKGRHQNERSHITGKLSSQIHEFVLLTASFSVLVPPHPFEPRPRCFHHLCPWPSSCVFFRVPKPKVEINLILSNLTFSFPNLTLV